MNRLIARCTMFAGAFVLLATAGFAAAKAVPPPDLSKVPPLLLESLRTSPFDTSHWAYTETTTGHATNGKEKADELTIVRFDPSQPYAGQYTPIKVHGHAPTEKDLREYRKKGEDRGKALAKAANVIDPAKYMDTDPQKRVDIELASAIDLEHITIDNESPGAVTYRVPLAKSSKTSKIPPEKIELLVRVNRERRVLENINIELVKSLRLALVANIKSADFSMMFTSVDPNFPPVMTSVSGGLDLTLFFVKKLNANVDMRRSDFKRVEPFENRFTVEFGPLRVLSQ